MLEVPLVANVLGAAFVAAVVAYFFKRFWLKGDVDRLPVEWRRIGTVGRIYFYPVKSCGGTSVEKAELKKTGVSTPRGRDRSFVVADKEGHLVSCKLNPVMLLINAEFQDGKLTLKKSGMPDAVIDVDAAVKKGYLASAQLFKDVARGYDVGEAASKWLGDAIFGDADPEKREKFCPLKLLYMPPDLVREMKHHKKILPHFDTSNMATYAAVTPYSIIGDGSIKELNEHMETGPTDERPFRPNIYVHGSAPGAENDCKYVKINDAVFKAIIAGPRCAAVNNDPDRGEAREEKPYTVLMKYRAVKDPTITKLTGVDACEPIMGMFFDLVTEGRACVGDDVFVFP